MVMKSYNDNYVMTVAENLGTMFEYAVDNNLNPKIVWNSFVSSNVAKQIECGNPKYLSCSGIDYLTEIFGNDYKFKAKQQIDKDKYYWSGWILAQYAQQSGHSFYTINQYFPIEDVLNSYNTLHEADITKFYDVAKERFQKQKKEVNLKIIRKASGLSQKELSEKSGVDIRSIQMYEQKRNDINKAQVETLYKLAKVFGCNIEDLMEE